jgi:hypothetical protein
VRVPVAIVIAGALVAIAILVALRWQITAASGYVYRLDRWTGHITVCGWQDVHRIDCSLTLEP